MTDDTGDGGDLPYKPLPMPIWIVTDHHLLRVATGSVRRSVLMLAAQYWLGGCQPLPADDTALAVLAATNIGMWMRDRDTTRNIITVVFKQLKITFDKQYTKIAAKRERAIVANAASRASVARSKIKMIAQNGNTDPVVTSTRRVHVTKPTVVADIFASRADNAGKRNGEIQHTTTPRGFRD